jgi:hypothetical protein
MLNPKTHTFLIGGGLASYLNLTTSDMQGRRFFKELSL